MYTGGEQGCLPFSPTEAALKASFEIIMEVTCVLQKRRNTGGKFFSVFFGDINQSNMIVISYLVVVLPAELDVSSTLAGTTAKELASRI